MIKEAFQRSCTIIIIKHASFDDGYALLKLSNFQVSIYTFSSYIS